MAYENYSFVSWSDGTPITGARLAQMSTNIEQVKDANDDKPKGILKWKQNSSNIVVTSNIFTPFELIALKDEGGGTDNRVTIDTGRYYRITIHFPGFVAATAGGEDSTYFLSLNEGIFGGVVSEKANYKFNSGVVAYVNTASAAANINNIALTTNRRFAAGTYSVVVVSTGLTNASFHVKAGKVQGLSNNNASSYTIAASDSPMQLYIEDIGGVA